jgi:hypothetical protein
MSSLANITDDDIRGAALIKVYDPGFPSDHSNPRTLFSARLAGRNTDVEPKTPVIAVLSIVLKPGEAGLVRFLEERIRRIRGV